MVTIDIINEMGDGLLLQKVEEYRLKLKNKQNSMRDVRKKRIEQARVAKELANQMLPEAMTAIDQQIRHTLTAQGNFIYYECGDGLKGMYLASLLIQIMLLEGFLCTVNNSTNTVKISW